MIDVIRGILLVLVMLIGLAFAICLYCLPSFIAWVRKAPNFGVIVAINLLFGWTFIGWCAAAAFAMVDRRAPQQWPPEER
jgi:hypothetical protein